MKKLREIFNIYPGNDLELCYLSTDDNNGVNFISRTSKNNGISAKVELLENIVPFPANSITVSLGGSVLETFIQDKPFYTGYHMRVLIPKELMSINQMQYYCLCIKANKFKYSFGRQANKTLADILVPEISELPKWIDKKRKIEISSIPDCFLEDGYEKACWYLDNIDQTKFENLYKGNVSDTTVTTNINTNVWHEFKIEDLFIVSGTRTTKKGDLEKYGEGLFPYVTTRATNNGIDNYYDYYTENGNVLTIDSATIGFCSYQEKDFSASDHVEKLIPKFKINKYIALFLITIINKEQFRYDYGRKYNQQRIKKTVIKLPIIIVNDKLYPDFEYMENYIKSLQYSKSL